MTGTTGNSGGTGSVVTVFPQAVLDDVDAMTHRRVHGDLSDKDADVRDTAGADSREPFDRGTLTRHLSFRDAQARRRLRALLDDPMPQARAWDDWAALTEEEARLPIRYALAKTYGSGVLRTAAAYLHRFLVRGVARDWMLEAGIEPLFSEEELDGLLDDLLALLRGGYVRTPLHPWDPKRWPTDGGRQGADANINCCSNL